MIRWVEGDEIDSSMGRNYQTKDTDTLIFHLELSAKYYRQQFTSLVNMIFKKKKKKLDKEKKASNVIVTFSKMPMIILTIHVTVELVFLYI